jgi:hypothetical protein
MDYPLQNTGNTSEDEDHFNMVLGLCNPPIEPEDNEEPEDTEEADIERQIQGTVLSR